MPENLRREYALFAKRRCDKDFYLYAYPYSLPEAKKRLKKAANVRAAEYEFSEDGLRATMAWAKPPLEADLVELEIRQRLVGEWEQI